MITEQGGEEIGRIDRTVATHRDDACIVRARRSVGLLFFLRVSRCRDYPLLVSLDYCTERALVTPVYCSVLYCTALNYTVLYLNVLHCTVSLGSFPTALSRE
jgi:hypothetical protein